MKNDYNLEKRKFVIGGTMLLVGLIYLIRLFLLQVPDNDYKTFADSNAFLKKIQYPSRGLIYDRNDKLLVYNQPAYDIMMIMREVQPFDTLDFCNTIGITKEQFHRRIAMVKDRRLNPGYSAYTPQTFISQLSAQDYGRLQEKLYKFPGFFIQNRMLRQYTYNSGANILGNIREVSLRDIENDDYYIRGDYTGDLGVEKSYEKYLRGEKGVEILLRDAHGRIKGRFENGIYDESPVSGKNLKLSIDVELQEYGEKLMKNKIGAIVAIEPSTGEVLALVSSPGYDPSSLIGRERGKNYLALNRNPYKPLYDRAIMATYPPGSTFKPTQGLIYLQEGIISTGTMYPCYHGFISGRLRVGCHVHESPLSLLPAIRTSCNAYFCYGLKSMLDNRQKYRSTSEAFEIWKDYMVSMGYGYRLGIDLPGESRGFIPNSNYYSKIYGENRWRALTIISIAIGQGEILATPLQIANLSATIANRGYFYTPHVVKEIQDNNLDKAFTTKHYTKVDPQYYEAMVEGMRMAVTGGTCRMGAIPGIEMCGKTGTAQNPHGKDHSAFMGFAPMNNPKIAICVYVENAGFGATYGVPIGSLMIEKYLKGKISPEREWIEQNMLKANTIIFSGIKGN
ncbi:penicillin-binding transpeptidase domain-containing protein [Coprobacter tertius]|uniref:Penicillin-binding transpeptidase domain-containing protein n=1 Tax=Coprobacter tertius TaxID=2944915 RepID=A0ABT1MEW7_9BACT|nr:penicillin-binding transpeptidase domain-containing protein [Coprobacter tertius]